MECYLARGGIKQNKTLNRIWENEIVSRSFPTQINLFLERPVVCAYTVSLCLPTQVLGEKTAVLSSVLLRLRPCALGDPGAGVRHTHYTGPFAERVRQHQNRQVPRKGLPTSNCWPALAIS